MEMTQVNSAKARATSPRTSDSEWIRTLQRTVDKWFSGSGRDFPWRRPTDSFHVLVAEVLLRRTQAERVTGPYLELIERFPESSDMAEADVSSLREWFRPLGLVGRADLLVDAAKALTDLHGGEVPNSLGEVEELPGIGRYSARALLCMVHGWSVPMVDESSGRLLRRLLGLSNTGPAYADRKLLDRAEALVPQGNSRAFNLGLLDIAAAYCFVRSPDCVNCPLLSLCPWGHLATEDADARATHA